MGAGNQTPVLWKSSQCPWLLSHLSSLISLLSYTLQDHLASVVLHTVGWALAHQSVIKHLPHRPLLGHPYLHFFS